RTYFFSSNARLPSSNSASAVASTAGEEPNQLTDGTEQPAALTSTAASTIGKRNFIESPRLREPSLASYTDGTLCQSMSRRVRPFQGRSGQRFRERSLAGPGA